MKKMMKSFVLVVAGVVFVGTAEADPPAETFCLRGGTPIGECRPGEPGNEICVTVNPAFCDCRGMSVVE